MIDNSISFCSIHRYNRIQLVRHFFCISRSFAAAESAASAPSPSETKPVTSGRAPSPPKRPRSPIVGASIHLLFPLVPGILIRIISVFPFGACKGYTVTSACGLTDNRYAFTFSSSFSSLFFCYLNFRYFFHLSQYTKNPNSIVTFVLFAQIYLKSYLPAATSQSHYKLNLSFARHRMRQDVCREHWKRFGQKGCR